MDSKKFIYVVKTKKSVTDKDGNNKERNIYKVIDSVDGSDITKDVDFSSQVTGSFKKACTIAFQRLQSNGEYQGIRYKNV